MKHGQDAMTSRATPESKLIVTQSPFDAFVRKYGTIPRRGVFGYFVHELGRRIVGGHYPVGTTLPNEPDLVEQFGISRTVIREAMKCLAGKGLVEIKTRVGTRVKERANWHHLDTDVMVWYYETGHCVKAMFHYAGLSFLMMRSRETGCPLLFAWEASAPASRLLRDCSIVFLFRYRCSSRGMLRRKNPTMSSA